MREQAESVLTALTDDVDWQEPVSEQADSVSWAGRRRGREQVADDFREFTAASHWHPMEDATFTAAGDRVVVEGRNRNKARATGRPYEHQWVMLFTIRDGQIARFRHYYDPADITHALD
ncbi:MAG: nuclear transport factor 2 family protein [Acidimicrobiales bacterium]